MNFPRRLVHRAMGLAVALAATAALAAPNFSLAPGVVISYEPSPSPLEILLDEEVYIADCEIVVLPNGNYLASHSYFGSGSTEDTAAITRLFRSTNQGASWSFLVQFQPLWRASLFVYGGAVYLIGPTHNGTSYSTIRKSTDNGSTWTSPVDANTGRFESVPLAGTLGTPNNPLVFNNRLYAGGGGRATMSTPTTTADPLIATDWRQAGSIQTFATWPVGLSGTLGSAFIGEGGVVASPEQGIAVLTKVEGLPYSAVVRTDRNLGDCRFGPHNDFAAMPGAEKKFGSGYDAVSGKFYVLSNPILPAHAADTSLTPQLKRNTAAVLSSRDLMNWEVEKIFLYSPHIDYEGWQYFQFDYDGDDMVVASRTAFDVDDSYRPPRGHDSNLLTFHRLPDFRTHTRNHYLLADTANNQVLRYEVNQNPGDPAPLGKFTLGTSFGGAPLAAPNGIGVDTNADVYIRESGGRILRFDALGNFIAVVASSPVAFTGPTRSIAQPPGGARGWVKTGGGNWADMLHWYYWGRPDTTAEVATFGTAATAATTVTVDAGPMRWEFDTDADEEGWTTSGVSAPAVAGGVFAGTATTAGTPILNRVALALPGSQCPEVRVRVRGTGTTASIDFYWATTVADTISTARRVNVPYTGAGAFQEVVIPMAGRADWDGQTITRIRVDPPRGASATFEVDYVRIPQATFRMKGLRFRSASPYTISGAGSLRIEADSGNGVLDVDQGTHTVSVPVTLAGTTSCELTTGTSLTFNGTISGAGGIVKTGTGAGALRLAAANTYRGDTVNSVGSLVLLHADALAGSTLDTGSTGAQSVSFSAAGTNTYTLGGLKGVDGLAPGANSLSVGGNGQSTTFAGVVSGSGDFTKTGAGALTLTAVQTYTGDTVIDAGTLALGAAHLIPNGAGRGNATVAGTLALHGFSETVNGLSGAGIVDGVSGAPIFTVGANDQSSAFSGTIRNTAGSLALVKTGTGTLTLSGANTFSGGTTVSGGTLALTGSVLSAVSVNAGATLRGTGTVSGNLSINSGVHEPGNSAGIMQVRDHYTLQAGGTLRVEINGPAVGTQYDQVRLTAASSVTTLAGALDIVAAPGLTAGTTFTIVQNGGSPVVSGAFAGQPQGREFYEDAQWWRIAYNAGTGNDVTLTRLAPTGWQNWQAANFGLDANNAAIAGDTADLDLDGLFNLLEYALGGSPAVSDQTPLPDASIVAGRLALTFTRTLANTDLTLTVQGADFPAGPWTDLATSVNGAAFTALAGAVTETGAGATRTVQVRDQYLLTDPAHPRRFVRLRVTR